MCRCSDTLIQTLPQGQGNRKDIFDIRFFFPGGGRGGELYEFVYSVW